MIAGWWRHAFMADNDSRPTMHRKRSLSGSRGRCPAGAGGSGYADSGVSLSTAANSGLHAIVSRRRTVLDPRVDSRSRLHHRSFRTGSPLGRGGERGPRGLNLYIILGETIGVESRRHDARI